MCVYWNLINLKKKKEKKRGKYRKKTIIIINRKQQAVYLFCFVSVYCCWFLILFRNNEFFSEIFMVSVTKVNRSNLFSSVLRHGLNGIIRQLHYAGR